MASMSLLTKIRTLRGLKAVPEPELPEVARSVAIIMDGNGRWARKRSLPVAAGHRAGTRALRRTVEASIDLGVASLTVYAFSTENWSRPVEEVEALMEIFVETIERELPDLKRQGVRTRFIGRRDRAPAELQERMAALEDETAENDRLKLWIAFDYGGRAEIVEAARRLVEAGVDPADVDENLLAANLYAPDMPDPDLVIRTSGELRVSNFLLWQLAYAELVFVDRLWPDFGKRDLHSALAAYARRRRRFGGR
jgi:undecaprenyl diphosphate synthase